jgi:hypothetical protein
LRVADYIETTLGDAMVVQMPVIHGTGGPLKAIGKVVGAGVISRAAAGSLEDEVCRSGPPESLSHQKMRLTLLRHRRDAAQEDVARGDRM